MNNKIICPFVLLPWQLEAWMDNAPVLLFTQDDGKSAGGGKCVCAKTMISLQGNQSLPIEEIKIGDYVKAAGDRNKLEYAYRKVINIFNLGYKLVYKIKTADGRTLKCAGSHKLLTNKGWETVVNLLRKAYIAVDDKYCWDRAVEKIKTNKFEKMYDLEVEHEHNYIANGIVSHNSRCAGEKIHGFCQKFPGAMAMMLRKTRESTTNSIVLFMQTEVIGKDPQVTHRITKRRFEYANGSILAYGGMANEDQREQIRSIGLKGGLDYVWMEEANQFTEDDFNEVLARMRGNATDWRQIVLTCNPDSPAHWIYQRLILSGKAKVYTSGAEDNPHNPADYVKTLDTLTGVLRERLKEGRWVQAMGAVYDNFNPVVHIIDKLPDIEFKRVFSSIDWGYSNPGVILTFVVDNDNRIYLVNEIYRTKQIIDWWVTEAKQIVNRYPNHEVFVCDPSEPASIEKFNREGLNANGGNNNVSLGIQEVVNRLMIAGDGKPRLYFLRNALKETDTELVNKKQPISILDEITIYAWKKDRSGIVTKEEPENKNNHALDGLRYGVMYLAEPERPALYSSSRSISTDKLLAQLGIG